MNIDAESLTRCIYTNIQAGGGIYSNCWLPFGSISYIWASWIKTRDVEICLSIYSTFYTIYSRLLPFVSLLICQYSVQVSLVNCAGMCWTKRVTQHTSTREKRKKTKINERRVSCEVCETQHNVTNVYLQTHWPVNSIRIIFVSMQQFTREIQYISRVGPAYIWSIASPVTGTIRLNGNKYTADRTGQDRKGYIRREQSTYPKSLWIK
jgi:hypothetical protein